MSSKPSVLFVLTSHNKLGNSDKPSGWFLPEFAHPYHVLAPVANITVASPAGGEAPLDPSSIDFAKDDQLSQDFLKNSSHLWKNTVTLSSVIDKVDEYDAIFAVGGHGPMFDLATDETSIKLFGKFADKGKIVSAVCHGPAALVNVKTQDGEYLIKGCDVTAFSNDEEEGMKLMNLMPFALETELKNRGATYHKAPEQWGVKVCVSGKEGKLITGQNPASATETGEAVKKALGL